MEEVLRRSVVADVGGEVEHSNVEARVAPAEVAHIDPEVLLLRGRGSRGVECRGDDVAKVHIAVQTGGPVGHRSEELADAFLFAVAESPAGPDIVQSDSLLRREDRGVARCVVQRPAHPRKADADFLVAFGAVADVACKGFLGVDAAELGAEAGAVGDEASGHRCRHVHLEDRIGPLQFVLRQGLVDVGIIEFDHRLAVAVVVACGHIALPTLFVVVDVHTVRNRIVHQAESLVEQADELLIGQRFGQFEQRSRQTAIVPFDILFAVGGVETVPQLVANEPVVAGNGADVRQFVADGDYLAVAVGGGKLVDLCLLFATPTEAFVLWCRFVLHQVGHALAKLAANLVDSDIGILDNIVQNGRCQQLLVVGDGGHDGGSLHRVDDVGETFAATFGAAMGFDCEAGCAVKQTCF